MKIALSLLFLAMQLGAAVSPEFAARRAELRKKLPNGLLVLWGNKESEDLHDGFFQEPNFFYLTGWEQPGAILMMTPQADKDAPDFAKRETVPGEILFLPRRIPGEEKWTGRKLGPSDEYAGRVTGFGTVLPAEQFETELRMLLGLYPDIYTLKSHPGAALLEKLAPARAILDATPALASMRMQKSPGEITLIRKATDASMDAHRAAWKAIRPGQFEYQIAALMIETYMAEGCQRSAYAPIVGTGPNSTTLHYSQNSRRMEDGDLVVMDVAGEYDNYASDITRTVPVNGKFTARQREIYQVVLGAQQAAIAAVKPGMLIGRKGPNSLYKIAYDYINSHGKDLHDQPLGKYFTHGLSHHVGLDVHDEADNNEPLKIGMVITIEPGIYIPEEKIGVRIEDVLLVTDKGSEVLSGKLPKDADEIERAMAGRK